MNNNIIKLTGRIDSVNAPQWEKTITEQISAGTEPVFDAAELEYISSAGLRVLMKAKKQIKGEMRIINVSSDVYDIFDMTGFTELFTVEKRMREISVDGCEVIGEGFFGTVYRIDPETIVKVYHTPDCIPMIRSEQRLARLAFIKGVPTAISYDIVKVGDNYGSVFELLDAQSFNDHLINEPDNFDKILRQYVDFLKLIHDAEMDKGTLPMARDRFIGYLDVIKDYLNGSQYDRLRELLSAMPDDLHMVHCDFQMKNVMLVGDEPMLIDMDTISTGQPIFDLQALYVTYVGFPEDDPGNLRSFLGIPDEWGDRIWQDIMRYYFDSADESELKTIGDKIQLLAMVRFLYLLASTDMKNGELGEKRIGTAQNHISELLETVHDLAL
ncbi:MAG: anti-sigma factor antagonist [Ruminococcus sp.]|nr:anti-sigma factor antagonist [Ruminococcus sp.]